MQLKIFPDFKYFWTCTNSIFMKIYIQLWSLKQVQPVALIVLVYLTWPSQDCHPSLLIEFRWPLWIKPKWANNHKQIKGINPHLLWTETPETDTQGNHVLWSYEWKNWNSCGNLFLMKKFNRAYHFSLYMMTYTMGQWEAFQTMSVDW